MIYRTLEDQTVIEKEHLQGGEGVAVLRQLLAPEEMLDRGRMFNRITLPVAGTVGPHRHDGEQEFYFILSGKGQYQHDDDFYDVVPGDVVSVDNHHVHGLKNTGDEELTFIALILFADDHE